MFGLIFESGDEARAFLAWLDNRDDRDPRIIPPNELIDLIDSHYALTHDEHGSLVELCGAEVETLAHPCELIEGHEGSHACTIRTNEEDAERS